MKKFVAVILVSIIIIFAFSSCERSIYEMEREAKREAAFNDGYEAGYEEGYQKGVSDAQKHLIDELQDISWDIKDENGIDPETAAQILANYADGEPVTEQELEQAIWTIRQYYWDSYWAINDSDSYNE